MLSPSDYVNNALSNLDKYISFALTATTVNQYERLSVERFIDFKSKYIYKESDLKRVLKFFSLINIPIGSDVVQYPIQQHEIFWLANIYALYKDENTRLFDQTYISIAKGNNKSTFASVCAIYEAIAKGTINAHILLVASSREQARILINYIDKIITNSPALADMFTVNRNIIYDKNKNRIEIKSSDVGSVHGIGAGMTLSVIDEFAVHKNSQLQQVIKSAQEAKQHNHHQLIITHASSDKFVSPAYDLQQTCENILKRSVIADNIFTQIFTLDSIEEVNQPEMWRKSNPMLNISVPVENLKRAYDTALIFPDKLATFKTYNLNLWIDNENEGENWLSDIDVIKESMCDFEFDKTKMIFCGVDLSHQRDLSAIAWLQYDAVSDIFYADVQFIFPNNERKKIKEHGSIDLSRWFITDESPDNYIIRCDTPVLDHELIVDFFKSLNDELKIDTIGYDKYQASQISYKLQSFLGVDVTNVEMNWKLTTAIQFVERLLLTDRLKLKKNPVLRWNFQNVLIKQSDNGNLFLKKKNRESIDGVVAIVIAFAVWIENNFSKHQIMIDGFDKIYSRK